jgi:DNA-binding transcriptional LysR family regulator
MDQFEMIRTFVAVADRGSFVEAARRLRVSPTAASRSVAMLEKTLGTALLSRTTRSVRMTEAGAFYLERCRGVLADLDDAALALRGDGATPGGTLVITAPVTFGRLHILPIATGLLRDFPMLKVEMTLIDRVVRLVDEGIDIAVRIGDLSDSSLHALKTAEVRRVLVASPAYLAKYGTPANVPDLHQHALISFTELERAHDWRFGPAGKTAIRIEPRLIVNTADAAIAAAAANAGIARVLSYQTFATIAAGHVVTLLDEYAPPPLPVHLVYQANRRASVNVRAFIEAAKIYFADLDLVGSVYPSGEHRGDG